MTRYNVALLSLLASTALAVPHYGQHRHGHPHPVHPKSGSYPSGVFPPGPFPTAGPTAPYGQGNTTTIAPTGSAPVPSNTAITSIVTVVPQPVSSDNGNSPIETSAGAASSGLDKSPVGGSSAPGGECGPATVTVTSADTVTITVPASSAPVESTPVESPVSMTSAPYGNGTTSAPIGTGTGTAGTGSAIPHTSSFLPIIPTPGSSKVYESPSVAHPVPLVPSSVVENSPQTASTTTVPAEGGQFHQAQTTPAEVAPTSKIINSPEQATTSTPISIKPTTSTPTSTPISTKPTTAPTSDNVVPRGLVYSEASLTSHFDNANVGWLYNWDSTPGGTVDSSKEFIPMLWDTLTSYHTPHWETNANAAIAAGSKHLLAFNEPDLGAQANMNVGQSVEGWMKYMEPFHTTHNGAVKLGSPSVCNGPDANQGLAYLASFLAQCAGCHVDFLAIHWYGLATDDGVQNLKDHIGKATAMAGGRPIWLTEFQPSGSDAEQAKFLGAMLPWLDDKSNGVERYAYFKVDTMVNGGGLTETGTTYAA